MRGIMLAERGEFKGYRAEPYGPCDARFPPTKEIDETKKIPHRNRPNNVLAACKGLLARFFPSKDVMNHPPCTNCIEHYPLALDNIRISDAVMAWDMTNVKQHALEEGVYTAGELDDAEREYKRFIILCFSGESCPISRRVDKMWHEHILFTENYAQFCQEVGGRFLHHVPCILYRDEPITERLTYDGYRARWGEPDSAWWDGSQACKDGSCGCKSCKRK